jgi:hypothetical protein
MDLYHLRKIGEALYLGICVAAVLRGDRPLRYVGAAIVFNSVITPIVQWRYVRGLPNYGEMVVDLVLLAFMSAVLIRDRRWWLVAATSFLLVALLTHIAPWVGAPISAYMAATVRLLWNNAMVLAVGWGLALHEHRRQRGLVSAVPETQIAT